jgi:ABC-type proline/glycine betaine transport system permease subunit
LPWAIAIALSIPLALAVTGLRWLAVPVLGGLGILYTIPSLALIIFLVPLFGLNATAVIVAMVLYTQVILVRNLTVGLAGINPAVLEAARGMGMSVAAVVAGAGAPGAAGIFGGGSELRRLWRSRSPPSAPSSTRGAGQAAV